MTTSRITAKRQLVQWLMISAALLLPAISVGGNPFLRMDISLRTLFLVGVPVRVDQFYLVLLATLLFVVIFLLVTVVLGRVWCGWLCPQTVFNDLADLIGNKVRKRLTPGISRLLEHFTAVSISVVISFNLLCWFMAPSQVLSGIRNFSANPLLMSCFLLVLLFGYLNLMLVKRSFCRSYCPYGRFQAALTDQATLNLAFIEETRDRCLHCDACVRICPMGIDIRKGYQIECINCGRCIDACREVMDRRPGGAGLIDYHFGSNKGTRFSPGIKTVVLSLLTAILAVGLIWGLAGRNQSAFALQRIATAEPRIMTDGFQAQPWRAIIGNRSETPKRYSITVASDSPQDIRLLGPVHDIVVVPNEHREITFLLCLKRKPGVTNPVKIQLMGAGMLVASVEIKP